jgi:hypothetical protein
VSSQRPTSRWLPLIDVKWIAIAVALLAVTWVLVTPRYLPFQDIPNHVHLLEIDRDLDAPTTYLARSDIHTLGYSLYIWVSRLSAPLLSAQAVLRLLVVVTALATPLAAGAIARALGLSAPWAILLALPLALSWPTRVGLVPFALAIPPALFAVAAALRDDGRRRKSRVYLEVASFATLTYLAHAYVFACLCFVLLVAWATVGGFGRRALVTAALGIAPGVVLSLHDLREHAFDPIAATGVTLFHAPRWYRPAGLALSHLATRSYAITGPVMLLAFLPLLVLLTVAAVAGATGIGAIPRRGGRTFLVIVAVAGSLGTLAIPESQGLVFLLASRTLVIGALFWTVLAAGAADRARGVRAVLLGLAPLVALGASLAEVARRARQVEQVVGARGPERLEGRYLTVQIPDCANASSLVWGGYDSFRHLWAYALGRNGVSPYLFSASRYQPIWYRSDTFREKLRGPPEHPMNENELPLEPDACRAVGRERLLAATSWAEYDGVIVTKAAGGVEEALTPEQNRVARHLAPGMALVVGRPPSPRTSVDFGTPQARARLTRGWSTDEIVDERSVVWSDGPTSAMSLVMAPSDTPYVLTWQAKGIAAQAVAVALNGRELGEVVIREAWERVFLFAPPGIVAAGANQLVFTYAKTVKPEAAGDLRELGMLVDDLLLEPMDNPQVLALGSPELRPHLLSGWGADEVAAGVRQVVASAARPRLGFVFRRLPRHTRIRLIGEWPQGRTLTMSLNHRPWGFLVGAGPNTAELVVPPGALQNGWNELELSDGARSVEDETKLDLALRRLEIEDLLVYPFEVSLGKPEDRPFLAGGFATPESEDGVPGVNTQGDVSALGFAFDLPASEHYLLGLRGRAANGRTGAAGAAAEPHIAGGGRAKLAVSLNGQRLASVDFGATWSLATAVLGSEVRGALSAARENLLELRAIDAGGGSGGGSATGIAAGARPSPTQVTLRELFLVPVSASDEVDVGQPSQRRRLQHGWSGNEYIDGRAVVWTEGRSASVVFHVLPGASDDELDWEARAYAPIAPVSVTLALNGHRLGRVEVPADFRTGVMRVPRSALKAGVNVLEVEPSITAQPAKVEKTSLDERELGVLFDRVALRPLSTGP